MKVGVIMTTKTHVMPTRTSNLIGTPYSIIQPKGHEYNLDSILLSQFIMLTKNIKTIVEFGTGQGVILLYLSLKTRAKLIGYEIQEELANIAKENVNLNQLSDRIEIIHQDIQSITSSNMDCIVSNPPYFQITPEVKLSDMDSRARARHEIDLTLEALFREVSQKLRTQGTFYFIHRASRFEEIMTLASKYHLKPKRIQFVHPYAHKEATQVLVKCIKGGNSETKIDPPFILYEDRHVTSRMLQSLYKGE